MARKSTDEYQAVRSTGMTLRVLGAVLAAILVLGALYILSTPDDQAPEGSQHSASAPSQQGPVTGDADCANCPYMIQVPTGAFTMGLSPAEQESDNVQILHAQTETPSRGIVIDYALAVGRTEVTRGQFADFVAATGRVVEGGIVRDGAHWVYDPERSWRDPGFAQTDDHPVVCVSFEDAAEYALWLSQRTLNPYRLLREAEWEYVARAGIESSRPWQDMSADACKYGNVADKAFRDLYPPNNPRLSFPCTTGFPETAPVGQFEPNSLGLYGLFGNVRERIGGCWQPNHNDYALSDPVEGWMGCSQTIAKGGGWSDPPASVRVPRRLRAVPGERRADTGFRVAKELRFSESPN